MIAVMSSEEPALKRPLALSLEWDPEVGAGYLAFGPVRAGEAVSQRIVENPVPGIDDIVLDFDEGGRLLGIEFLDKRALPRGLAAS
ncbi:MAG: hypothetical protein JWP46_3155 [Modestobacter sp.]|nr:hypothetical protein [Modestobacter sp.]